MFAGKNHPHHLRSLNSAVRNDILKQITVWEQNGYKRLIATEKKPTNIFKRRMRIYDSQNIIRKAIFSCLSNIHVNDISDLMTQTRDRHRENSEKL